MHMDDESLLRPNENLHEWARRQKIEAGAMMGSELGVTDADVLLHTSVGGSTMQIHRARAVLGLTDEQAGQWLKQKIALASTLARESLFVPSELERYRKG